MKCVMIVDGNLPIGMIANTTAALGVSLASEIKGLAGKKVIDKHSRVHEGITNIPIPVLTLSKEKIKEKYDVLLENNDPDIKAIGFSDVAQKSLDYDDYEIKLSSTNEDQINYLGVCLYGPKKKINKLTGSLTMLR
ncbi:Protein of unknown function [Anaerovirgula multivorans]|uniref:DUF2000 domain-containing protein n=1 Tax=Anaerovirgula multivorans TaxID=312168 RepID=A0A239F674_9FIRM|nr:DUF2000 domain-containing protein [Anaerovirgula multivorans]SNS52386.1 Protein of unknown function [Anaerovirgula multivorans]